MSLSVCLCVSLSVCVRVRVGSVSANILTYVYRRTHSRRRSIFNIYFLLRGSRRHALGRKVQEAEEESKVKYNYNLGGRGIVRKGLVCVRYVLIFKGALCA